MYAGFVHILLPDNTHNSKGSLLDGYRAERKSLFLPFDPLGSVLLYGDGLSGCRAFQRVGEMNPPNIVVYHPSGWRDRKKKTKGRRKEPVFHPISLERQCCALVIV